MNPTPHKKTIYQYTTTSPGCAAAIDIVLNDPRARELLQLFSRIRSPKRRNILLRMAGYLVQPQYIPQNLNKSLDNLRTPSVVEAAK